VPNLDNIPPLDGAQRAADMLLDRVQARSRRRPAAPIVAAEAAGAAP
jgi:hypothetical protein